MIVRNQIVDSQGHGMVAFEASVVAGNSLFSNGGVGFAVREGSLLLRNTAAQSTGLGAVPNIAGHVYGYADNVFTSNGTDPEIQVLGGVELGKNLCGSDEVCP